MNDMTPALADRETAAPADDTLGLWTTLRLEAMTAGAGEMLLAAYMNASILHHARLQDALSYHLAQKLGGSDMNPLQLREVCEQAHSADPRLIERAERDLRAYRERDPAARGLLQPFLYYKGFSALQAWRVAHWLWGEGREAMALHLQSRISELFQVDIHPAAEIGAGVFLDHATGIVIGETARVGDDVSMLHGVTLGGTGKERGDRHPKIGNGVLLGAGAKVLGPITVGDRARVASGSVVLRPVPPHCTVAGVPARPVGGACANPAESMDQTLAEYAGDWVI
jgi:serine O-acetyltransferase